MCPQNYNVCAPKLCLQCFYFSLQPFHNHVSKAFDTCTGVRRIVPAISKHQNGCSHMDFLVEAQEVFSQEVGQAGSNSNLILISTSVKLILYGEENLKRRLKTSYPSTAWSIRSVSSANPRCKSILFKS